MVSVFREFMHDREGVGAVAESSSELAGLVARTPDLARALTVVEVGPGTGVFTERIARRIGNGTLFFTVEINRNFAMKTRERCPGVTVYNGSAVNLKRYLRRHGREECDCVVSSLPWAGFDAERQEELLGAIAEALSPGGEFVTLAYLSGLRLPGGRRFRRLLLDNFGRVTRTRTVWRNIPPAFLYHCQK